MVSLIYVSRATADLGPDELTALGEAAAAANAANGITGMLAYNGEHFMQLLEGQDAAVDALLARIVADSRHRDLVVIRRDERPARECPYWSMRAFLTPLTGAGSATEFAARLPETFATDTRVVFTSFASIKRELA
ncbi:MAG: BLUF domain-containing protein [Novosphingobium sp.]|jgi:hypothetical protein|uniref:BLUF domain-containing protein n=1 Tax=Novosphingobium sp. TaxID=1874826 RepID=UPI00391A3EF5|nr:BLUF domain-containing protein [Novosphingobium sp.]